MNECPYHKVRPELPPLTARLAKLPVDERGYPVPFFVGWVNGRPEFQLADARKRLLCKIQKLCWVCGERLAGERKAFLIGPMCIVNRTTAEPPSHLECAQWSAKGCPFLVRPHMVRRENEVVQKAGHDPAGVMLRRNPGAVAIWETKEWRYFKDGHGGELVRIGEPEAVTWWREGRPATRAEVVESIDSGLPLLLQQCYDDDDRAQLKLQHHAALQWLPKEVLCQS